MITNSVDISWKCSYYCQPCYDWIMLRVKRSGYFCKSKRWKMSAIFLLFSYTPTLFHPYFLCLFFPPPPLFLFSFPLLSPFFVLFYSFLSSIFLLSSFFFLPLFLSFFSSSFLIIHSLLFPNSFPYPLPISLSHLFSPTTSLHSPPLSLSLSFPSPFSTIFPN